MNYLTPDQAVMARETLSLSQARVAKDTGINRAYLSQFEGSKRVLEDRPLANLYEYYVEQGWKPEAEASTASVKQRLSSDKHDLIIMDGLVIAPKAFAFDAEALLDESYEIEEEIVRLKQQKLKRGLFGGLDKSEAMDSCIRPLILMNRQCEIREILQGKFEYDHSDVDLSVEDNVQTVVDYLELLLRCGVRNRPIHASMEGEAVESSVDAVT